MDAIEQEIQEKGLTAPRITPESIEENIANEYYFTAKDGADGYTASCGAKRTIEEHDAETLSSLTLCVLILKNGFMVTGESACASLENFNAEIGQKIARQNAINKIWPLMGYELKSKLAESQE